MQEQWRQIDGYESLYDVSNLGRVRSYPRPGTFHQFTHMLTIRPRGIDPRWQYLSVKLSKNNKAVEKYVHLLVLEAFIGPRPEGLEAGHSNGEITDNRLTNLSWITKKQNAADRTLHGTQLIGQKHHQAKLTDQDAMNIYHSKAPTKLLSQQYSVCKSTIRNIRSGYNWSQVTQCHAKTVNE